MMHRPVVAAIALATLCSPALAEAPGFIRDGRMPVCTTAGFPPLTFREDVGDERPIGIDIDIIEEVARRHGAEVDYVITDFPGLLPSLSSGRCTTIISGIWITDKRRETYDGARYMHSATVIVVGGDTNDIASPQDLSGRKLALENGTFYGEEIVDPLNAELQQAGRAPIEVDTYPSQQEATQQVLFGRSDATLTEEAEGAYRVARSDGAIKIAYTYPSVATYGIYIQKDAEDFAALLQTLEAMRSDGFFNTVAATYGLDPKVFDVDFGG